MQLPAGYQRKKAEPWRMTNSSSHPALLSHAVPLWPLRLQQEGQHPGGCRPQDPRACAAWAGSRALQLSPWVGRVPWLAVPQCLSCLLVLVAGDVPGWARGLSAGSVAPGALLLLQSTGNNQAGAGDAWWVPAAKRLHAAPPARLPFASSPSHSCPLTSGASNLSWDCWK